MSNSQANRFVGPVIKNSEIGDAVLEAIYEDNEGRTIEVEEHEDDEEEHAEMVIHIIGTGDGTAIFKIQLMHEGHADYTSKQISLTVNSSMSAQLCPLKSCSCCLYAAK